MESSNDAAEVLAENIGRDAFLQRMNEVARSLGMSSTFYEDPSGLSAQNQSTALDLFRLAQYIIKEKGDLLQITTTRSHLGSTHSWFNNSQFLKKEGFLGGKSGYTDPAKQTLLSFFSVPLGSGEPRHLAVAILGSRDRLRDAENILKYLKANVNYGVEVVAAPPPPPPPPVPEVIEPEFVTLAFLGDIMLDRGVKNSVERNFDSDYSELFEKMDVLKKPDITFANLEGPASDRGRDLRNLYSFRMDPSIVPALKGAGIDILSVANNHVGDFGVEAFSDTLARLKENEILYIGGAENRELAEMPTIIEKNGMRIGFLGFSDQGPDWMRAKADEAGILIAENPRFAEIIRTAAEAVDYLVVSFHFGEEYETSHNSRQEQLAHEAIDNGAKLVIGHHPHVMQDTESYRDGFIAYSLGNFIFDQAFQNNTMEGMLLEIKLDKLGVMEATKNIVKLNDSFQPDQIIEDHPERVGF